MKKHIFLVVVLLLLLAKGASSILSPSAFAVIRGRGGGAATTAYGVIWDQSTDTYDIGTVTGGTFTEEAVSSFPIQDNMKRVVLSDAGVVQYYLCSTDSTLKENCSDAANIDGTDGQVMVQIPAFHYIQAQAGDNRYFFVADGSFSLTLSDESVENSAVHPAFTKAGSPVDYRYIGAYEGSMWDDSASAMTASGSIATSLYASGDKMCSISGEYPKTNEKRDEYRPMAEARGTGWHQMDANTYAAVSILYITEFANFNTQSEIGAGRVSLSGGTWAAGSYIWTTGLSNSDGNGTNSVANGGTSYSTDYMTYRGIENWYGHVWKFVDGVNAHNSTANGSRLYTCGDYTDFADDTDTNYTLAGSLAETDGYAKDIVDTVGIWPSVIGGSSSTYIADYYYTYYDNDNDSGWRVALLGGYAGDGSAAGAFCVSSYRASSLALAVFGGRLCF